MQAAAGRHGATEANPGKLADCSYALLSRNCVTTPLYATA